MRRAAHPSGCARFAAGAGCSAIEYSSLEAEIWEGRCSELEDSSDVVSFDISILPLGVSGERARNVNPRTQSTLQQLKAQP